MNIRRQLGPTRKRVNDRIAEANVLIEGDDLVKIQNCREKLEAVLKYHEQLTESLCEVTDVADDEQAIINEELNQCTNLNMDALEMMGVLKERIDGILCVGRESEGKEIKVKEQDKLDR